MSDEKQKDVQVIEINGVKLEVDMRYARRVDTFRVGDPVKVLKKEYNSYKSYYGTIVGFDAFAMLPTIIVCYLENNYSDAKLCFAYINAESKDVEVCPTDVADIGIERDDVLDKLDNEVVKKQEEIKELKRKRKYFLEHFQQYFGSKVEAK